MVLNQPALSKPAMLYLPCCITTAANKKLSEWLMSVLPLFWFVCNFNRVLQFTDLASEAQFIFLPLSSRSAFEIKAACSEVDWGSYESFVIQRRMYYSRICVCVCERESLTIWPLSAAWAEVLLTVMTSWLTGQLCICTREDQKQKEAGYCDVWPALWEEKKQILFKLLLDLTTLIIQSIQL